MYLYSQWFMTTRRTQVYEYTILVHSPPDFTWNINLPRLSMLVNHFWTWSLNFSYAFKASTLVFPNLLFSSREPVRSAN